MLSVRLPPAELAAAQRMAQQRGQSLSAFVRAAVANQIGSTTPTAGGAPSPASPARRVNVRLPEAVYAVGRRQAAARGVTLARWLAMVASQAAARLPVWTPADVQGLHRVAAEIASAGRNVNQIARALNVAPVSALTASHVEALRDVLAAIEAARQYVAGYVRLNVEDRL